MGSKQASAPPPPPTPLVDTAYISSNVPQLTSNLLEGDPERINHMQLAPATHPPAPPELCLLPLLLIGHWLQSRGLEALPAPSNCGQLPTPQTALRMPYVEAQLRNGSGKFQGVLRYHFPELRKHLGPRVEDTEQLVSREGACPHAKILRIHWDYKGAHHSQSYAPVLALSYRLPSAHWTKIWNGK